MHVPVRSVQFRPFLPYAQCHFANRRTLLFQLPLKVNPWDVRVARLACKATPWRPSLDDVERISRGDAAKVRGTGSRMIPHRLNQEERKLWEFAKKKGFLTVRGTGYRRERKGAPLANSFRQWCDAREAVCVVIEQDRFGGSLDTVVVDVSTLRLEDPSPALEACKKLLAPLDVVLLTEEERPLSEVPFSVIPAEFFEPSKGQRPEPSLILPSASSSAGSLEVPESAVGDEIPTLEEAHRAVEMQASVVRNLKAQGLGNKDPAVQAEVAVLLKLKEDLKLAEQVAAAQSSLIVATTSESAESTPAAELISSGSLRVDEHHTSTVSTEAPSAAAVHSTASTSSEAGPSNGSLVGNEASPIPLTGTASEQDRGFTVGMSDGEARLNGTGCEPHSESPGSVTESRASSSSSKTWLGPEEASVNGGAEEESVNEVAEEKYVGGESGELQNEEANGRLPKDHPIYKCAIWQIPSQPLFIRAPRSVAKEVAAYVVAEMPKHLEPVLAQ